MGCRFKKYSPVTNYLRVVQRSKAGKYSRPKHQWSQRISRSPERNMIHISSRDPHLGGGFLQGLWPWWFDPPPHHSLLCAPPLFERGLHTSQSFDAHYGWKISAFLRIRILWNFRDDFMLVFNHWQILHLMPYSIHKYYQNYINHVWVLAKVLQYACRN